MRDHGQISVFTQGVRWIDQAVNCFQNDILTPFALEDLWSRQVGQGERPILHLWRHERAMVLGLRDRKLPYAKQAIHWLEEQGYRVGVRHSGGAAVPLDPGVLNVTLILPKPAGRIDFRDDFALMAYILEQCVSQFGLQMQVGEIVGSYCPGDYDLSVNGRKFCGLAQRRQTRAIAVQAFVVVEGNGEERVRIVQEYYRRAAGEGLSQDPTAARLDKQQHAGNTVRSALVYPQVRSGTVASLAELVGQEKTNGSGSDVTMERFKESLSEMIGKLADRVDVVLPAALAPDDKELSSIIRQIRERYDRD